MVLWNMAGAEATPNGSLLYLNNPLCVFMVVITNRILSGTKHRQHCKSLMANMHQTHVLHIYKAMEWVW